MAYVRLIRIFVSSPGDVNDERAVALEVIDRLPYDPFLRGKIAFEVVAWDKPGADAPMRATMTPQAAINDGLPRPSDCDIVIVLFWKRMGTPLPHPDYQKPDGAPFLSGTEWEFHDGVSAERAQGRPTVLLYRRQEADEPAFTDAQEAEREQYRRVKAFFDGFRDADGSLRAGVNSYKSPDDFGRKLETHLRAVVKRLLDADPAPPVNAASAPAMTAATAPTTLPPVTVAAPPPWPGSPFPGLRAFAEADAPIFFGRGRETDALVRRVAERRFVGVVGASGSGKSSLVGAGLIPRLRANAIAGENLGSKDWLIVRCTPGARPFSALAAALMEIVPGLGTDDPIDYPDRLDKLTASLAIAPDRLARTLGHALKRAPDWAEVLVFIDQFEELFTLSPEAERAPFVAMLADATGAPESRVRVVATMRSDFYHRCVDLPALAELLEDGSFPLAAPGATALDQMIRRPAERADLRFDDGLPERILADTVGERGPDPGALALLAYALDELYEIAARRGDRRLTAADYAALRGVHGAIGTRADAVYARLDPEAQAALPAVFRELIAMSDDGAGALTSTPTRKRAALSAVAATPAAARLIEALAAARLLVLSDAGEGPGQAIDPVVEVAHEALFRSWGALATWIAEARADLILLEQLRRAAALWAARGRNRDYLWLGERGAEVQAMLARLNPPLNDAERAFARPEAAHLLDEIDDPATPPLRRDAIGHRLSVIGDPRPGVGLRTVTGADGGEIRLPDLDWCSVPGGEMTLEIDKEKHHFNIAPFYVARYLVTVAQFEAFMDAPDGFDDTRWWREMPEEGDSFGGKQRVKRRTTSRQAGANYPRDTITWYQAVAFARWVDHHYRVLGLLEALDPSPNGRGARGEGLQIRLPTEWEWGWMAGNGVEGREYPWGAWDDLPRANTAEANLGHSIAVGMFPAGAAACGALDGAGNLWEWCLNDYGDIKSISLENDERKVLRGGAFFPDQVVTRVATRLNYRPVFDDDSFGLRLVVSAPIASLASAPLDSETL
jgi:formylglycine-generating enzyme required for sulfatase activity/energy-coupling factor transporter ATP-binding protein EcfA2